MTQTTLSTTTVNQDIVKFAILKNQKHILQKTQIFVKSASILAVVMNSTKTSEYAKVVESITKNNY